MKTEAEAPKRDDAVLKEAVLLAALPHAAFDGFTESVLAKAGAEAGIDKADMTRLFENGAVSLIEYFSDWADAQMEARLAAMDLPAMKIRARIAAAVMARLDALEPHKEAARRAAAVLSLPTNAALGAKRNQVSLRAGPPIDARHRSGTQHPRAHLGACARRQRQA